MRSQRTGRGTRFERAGVLGVMLFVGRGVQRATVMKVAM